MSKKLKPTKGHEIGKIQDLRQLLDRAAEKYGDKIELIKQEIFNTEYHGYNYSICLIEKDN